MNKRTNVFSAPIYIYYRPPTLLLYLVSFSHSGAFLCLFIVSLPVYVIVLLSLLVIASFSLFMIRFYRERNILPARQLRFDAENRWALVDNNKILFLRMLPAALVHPLLVLVRFRSSGGKTLCFVLNAENVDDQVLRRLRVRLLHGKINVGR